MEDRCIITKYGEETFLQFRCPGCETEHQIIVDGSHPWTWNGDKVYITISPSILVTYSNEQEGTKVCHSFIINGQIQFLSDCYHKFRNETIDLPVYEMGHSGIES